MNSLNNFNTDLSAIFETIKEFNKKYSNVFFGIEMNKIVPPVIKNYCAEQIDYLNKITESAEQGIQEEQEIISEIKQEHLEEFDDEFDEEIDEDMKGEVESVILEMVDKIEMELEQEQVTTENTEEQEPVRNNEWTCKFCNKNC